MYKPYSNDLSDFAFSKLIPHSEFLAIFEKGHYPYQMSNSITDGTVAMFDFIGILLINNGIRIQIQKLNSRIHAFQA